MRTRTSLITYTLRGGESGEPRSAHKRGRGPLSKWLRLAALAVLGMCTVSIPLTVAIGLSATGASDVLTLGDITPKHHHATPAKAISEDRCVAKRGYYALTFDDGPSPATRELVSALAKAKAVATFFDIGERAALRLDLVELQRSVGQVANETYTAPDLTRVSQARRYQELRAAAQVLDYPNALFRPPYGDTNRAVESDVLRTGLTSVYWTVDADDAQFATSEIVARAMTVKAGGIIRLHDGRPGTIAAVPGIVERLRERGLCPGFIAATFRAVTGSNGLTFHAQPVKP